jgi:choline dehydrogenase-like flavoprotein
MRTGSWVRRIVHENGRATGVQFTDANGEEFFQPAETVILASFTLNNSRLLYLSKIGTPYDPAAGKGTLGRNLTHQVEGGIASFSTSRSMHSWARDRSAGAFPISTATTASLARTGCFGTAC